MPLLLSEPHLQVININTDFTKQHTAYEKCQGNENLQQGNFVSAKVGVI